MLEILLDEAPIKRPTRYWLSGVDGAEDGEEGIASREARSVDSGAQVSFGIGGPFCSVAVGDFSLDDAGPQGALADIVGSVDLAGEIAEGEDLVARAADLAEQFASQRAMGSAGEDGIEIACQRASSLFHRGDGKAGNVTGEPKGSVEPELKPHADKVAAMLGNEARLSIKMSKASLVTLPVPLLGGIAIRYPHCGFMSGHRVVHDPGGATEIRGMDNGLGRAEDPLVGIAAFDPRARFVASHNLGAAQNPEGVGAFGGKDRCGALEHVHQSALAEMKPKQIAKCTLQPFVGKQLVRLEIERQGMNARAKRCALCRPWRGRSGRLSASCAAAGQPAVPPDNRLDLGQINLVIFPDHRAGRIFGKWQAAMATALGAMVFVSIGRFGQNTGVPLMAGPGTARPRTLALRLPVRRWRLRRCPRRLVGVLHPQHHLDQLSLRKPFEFLAIHGQDESHRTRLGKGVGNYVHWMAGRSESATEAIEAGRLWLND